jgi:hypothetical protein
MQEDLSAVALGAEEIDLAVAIARLDVLVTFLTDNLARRHTVQRTMMNDAGAVHRDKLLGNVIWIRPGGQAEESERKYD